jgi:hypothetical protein
VAYILQLSDCGGQGRAHPVARCAGRFATVRRKKGAARRREGPNAVDVKVASFEGKITDQKAFADYGERRAYAELIVKLGGHFVSTNRIESPGPHCSSKDVRAEIIRKLAGMSRFSDEPSAD